MHQLSRAWTWLLILLLATLAFAGESHAQVKVRGYFRKDGTYVRPHYRSNPDGNFNNNWSTIGNVNPYTGKEGTKVSPTPNYGKDVRVRSYTRKDGTYVKPHYRSAPDGNFGNNWSTAGNVNPYTGKEGTLVTPPKRNSILTPFPTTSPAQLVVETPTVRGDSPAPRTLYQFEKLDSLTATPDEELTDDEVRVSGRSTTSGQQFERDKTDTELHGTAATRARNLPEKHTDDQSRMQKAEELRRLGYEVNWTRYTDRQLSELVYLATHGLTGW